jgi:hypothetical protein
LSLRFTLSLQRVSGRIPRPNWRREIWRASDSMRRFALADAQRRAADNTRSGEYMASIEAVPLPPYGFSLQSSVPQAWWLEFGTGLYGPKHKSYLIEPRPDRAAQNIAEYRIGRQLRDALGVWPEGFRKTPHSYLKWYTGQSMNEPVYARFVIAPGMEARPNLGQAIFENAEHYERTLVNAIYRAWNRG